MCCCEQTLYHYGRVPVVDWHNLMINTNPVDLALDIDNLSLSKAFIIENAEDCPQYIKQNKNDSLTLLTQNIRSIYKNFDEVIIMMERMNVDLDFIVLTECWLCDNKPAPVLSGYKTYRTLHNLNQNDGLVTYVKSDLNVLVNEPHFLDANCLVLKHGNTSIVCIYRPPAFKDISNFISSLDALLTQLKMFNNIYCW